VCPQQWRGKERKGGGARRMAATGAAVAEVLPEFCRQRHTGGGEGWHPRTTGAMEPDATDSPMTGTRDGRGGLRSCGGDGYG